MKSLLLTLLAASGTFLYFCNHTLRVGVTFVVINFLTIDITEGNTYQIKKSKNMNECAVYIDLYLGTYMIYQINRNMNQFNFTTIYYITPSITKMKEL